MISGIWLSVKSSVSGMMPQTLKATQVSVGEDAPDHLVDHRQEEEEQAPAERQLAPALGVEMEGRIEDVAEQRPAEGQAAEQHRAEQRVDDGRLHLDEDVVLQPERQRAEDEAPRRRRPAA